MNTIGRLSLRVYYEDTDAAGIVYYANYLRFLERGRTEYLRALGYGQEALARETGLAFAVRSLNAEYLLPAKLDDELIVASRIETLGRAQVVFAQQVLRGDTLLLDAKVKVVCIDAAKGKAAAVPRGIHEKLNAAFAASAKVNP
ncbi:tol-pal system-associated acyl-CoA thioesterase [Denitratisoma sp. agr-D3]